MAAVLRLIAFALLGLLQPLSYAADLCDEYRVANPNDPNNPFKGPSASAVCSAWVAAQQTTVTSGITTNQYTYTLGTISPLGYCEVAKTTVACTNGNCSPPAAGTVYVTYTKSSVNCQPQCPAAGETKGSSSTVWYAQRQGSAGSMTFCSDGCGFDGAIAGQDASGTYFGGPAVSKGATCTDSAATPNTTPSQVPPGKCPGTVNGTAVVVPCDKTWSAPTKGTGTTTTTNGSTTSTSNTGNTSQTTCNAAVCTTTTTTTQTNPDGSGGTTTGTSTQPRSEYCAKNPGDPQCSDGVDDGADSPEEDPSSFGGSCGGFSCSGDAVQCAMAQEQHRRNCTMFETATPISTIGSNAANAQDPADHPKNAADTVAVNLASKLSSVPLFGSTGQCPQDVNFSSQGHSFSLPFSVWCPYLNLLGAAFMAACYLAAGFIVFRRGD